jgi:hypothetical protein
MLIESVYLHLQMHFVRCLMVVIGWVYLLSLLPWFLLLLIIYQITKLLYWFLSTRNIFITYYFGFNTFSSLRTLLLDISWWILNLAIKISVEILIQSYNPCPWLIYNSFTLLQEKDARDIEIPNIRWEVFELMMRSNHICLMEVCNDLRTT